MSNVKISALPSQTAYTLTDVVAIVDGLSTNKIQMTDIWRNTSNVGESTTNTNSVMGATDAFSSGFNVLRGSNTTSAVFASTESYIDGGQNHFIGGAQGASIQTGAAGHGAIVGSDGVSITGGYNQFIGGSYNGPSITGGEENVILASVGGVSVAGNDNAAIATQGVVLDGSLSSVIAVEGSTQQAGNHMFVAGGYNYQSQINNLINQAHLGFKNLNVGDGLAGFNVGGSLGTEDCSVIHTRSVMSAASGRTTLYETTLHTDNIHTYQGSSTEWRQGGNVSGSINVDLSQGNLFSFTITGNLTSVQLDNARMGGEYEFFVYNNGSYTITTMNLDGNSNTIYSASGALNPTNNGYSFYRLRIVDDGLGGKIGVMKEYLNFSAI